MKKGKVGFENKGLVILLGVLGVMIVGLVVGIVVVSQEEEKVKEEEWKIEAEEGLPEELKGDDLSIEDQVVKETSLMLQDPNASDEDIELYYEEVIKKAIEDGDTSLAANVILQKMDFLVVLEDDCERAREYADSLNISSYPAAEKQYLMSGVVSMAIECDDSDWQIRWEDLYKEDGSS